MDYTTLKKNALESFFSRTNEMQKKAVFRVNGSVLIIAGAGSGKTTVLCNRIANMMRFGNAYHDEAEKTLTAEQERFLAEFPTLPKTPENAARLAEIIAVKPVNPWNILAITFTNKAAGELKSRLISMIGEGAEKINASTFHSACVKILRREIENLGYQRSFTIYDEDDSKRLIKDAMKRLELDEKRFPIKSFRNKISSCKDQMISDEDFAKIAYESADIAEKNAAEVYKLYQAALRAANALDFDDIIFLTVKLFENFPDVLEHYRNLYKYIMVDEYQDTNVAQYKLIALLAGKNGNLCVVGDDDQSIYRFRGATIENILSFEKQYPGCFVIRLEQNYRSTETILNAANAVISNNAHRKKKTLWSELGTGEKIKVCKFDSEQEESRFVADTILEGVKSGRRYTDYALLYRSNSQSRSFENTLARSGIPYTIVGGLRFYDRKEIKDIISYLAVINNPYDTVRFRRIINEPKRGIGEATVEEIIRTAEEFKMSPVEVCAHAVEFAALTRKAAALKAAANLFEILDELADTLTLDDLIGEVAEKTGYMQAMKALGDEGQTRIENINELKSNAVALMEENPEATLPDFLEQVSLVSDLDNYNGELDRVSLMTMHSAKGLEFDTVFMVGAEDNIFPSYRSMSDPAEMEEERRLAYVAITRAKRELYITHTNYRMLYGQTMRNRISTFVREIPEEFTEKIGESEKKQSFTWSKPKKPNFYAQEAALSAPRPAPVSNGADFSAGDRVKHNVFGTGTVTDAKRMGNDTMLTITFDNGQTKKVMANYARVEKI